MFVSALSRLLSAWFAFLLPCYATYKALARRPFSESDLQKWSMYWTVMGAFVAFEYLGEWLAALLLGIKDPFLAFPLFAANSSIYVISLLSLPVFTVFFSSQGSTYIYNAYLEPFFSRNQADLDAGIVRIQSNILTFVQEKLSALWTLATRGRPQSQAQSPSASPNPQLSWLFSPDTWRAALNVLQPAGSGTASRGVQPIHSGAASSSTSLNSEESSQKNPPFPVPQHYE
ncbi:Putative HVA22-like protein g [Psilocybe cubensis]|uniref:HVA22-like protein g n=2 Tax=Psilocybe cubensis TaxID=181762 RepID=A0ACB8HFU1_PSICU|nr:Putative HVA22-like protein g [Psilocybe cubensis]KAH9486585.1 Putative HVA22-like protein g [Psilocybe cubensis]